MKTQSDMTPEAELDALLTQARADPPLPDDAFMARVLADAQALQPRPQLRPARPARRGFWARLAATLGGAIAVAGLGTAAMAGLVIGYVQPEPMVSFAGSIGFGVSESLDLLPGFDALLSEDILQ
ncbi:dihydroorotate dehydrogenase [Pseudotabrizicola sp. 4114]|uniref:dihydroorotate dehydrogenase n=1 Tax=Pseudotabrizicola sp. 4114 TaxID=2817731 RepID=UPI0028628E93|nr:ferric-dicitrate binding protein FerR (iron transport regulator) [Pseudorhodobacter sp. 4114]